MLFRNISLYLLFLSSAAAAGSLRAPMEAEGEGCPHMKLFKAWSETHGKEYGSDEAIKERMKIWLENDSKFE